MSLYWKILLYAQLIAIGVLQVYLLLKYLMVSRKLRKILWESSGDRKRTLS